MSVRKEGSVIFYLVIIQKAQYQDGKDPQAAQRVCTAASNEGAMRELRSPSLPNPGYGTRDVPGREGGCATRERTDLSSFNGAAIGLPQHNERGEEQFGSAGTPCLPLVRAK